MVITILARPSCICIAEVSDAWPLAFPSVLQYLSVVALCAPIRWCVRPSGGVNDADIDSSCRSLPRPSNNSDDNLRSPSASDNYGRQCNRR